MKKINIPLFVSSIFLVFCTLEATAQNTEDVSDRIVITNAHIIDGTGRVIESGSIVVEGGLIVSVNTGSVDITGALEINVQGKTVMPGFIEGHRHVISGNPEQWLVEQAEGSMREFLEAGFTTVFSAIDAPQILELRRMLAEGEMIGPRILSGAIVPVAIPAPTDATGDPARTDVSRPPMRPTEPAGAIPDEDILNMVRQIAEAGYDAVKTVVTVTPGGPELTTLSLIIEESHRLGLITITHAVSVQDTLGVIQTNPDLLVHTPHIGQLTEAEAQLIANSGIPMTSTLSTFVPFFDENNQPIFRDALPYPWVTISSAGQGPVNARLLWEAGIIYGFGTDTSFLPVDTLAHELKSLHLTFSPLDIIKIMTTNTAQALGLEDEIGTLEAGKIADIVILEGNPLVDLYDLLKVRMVIKSGKIVVTKL